MFPRYHQHLVINVSIVVDEKVNKLGHEDLLLVEGGIKRGDACGIPSLSVATSGSAVLLNISPIPSSMPSVPMSLVVWWTATPSPSVEDLTLSVLQVRVVMMLKR